MTEKKITRGINDEFIEKFNESVLKKLYEENKDKLFLGIRNEYINLYYNCASVCKVRYLKRTEQLVCDIHKKYLGEVKTKEHDDYKTISPEDIYGKYNDIIKKIQTEAYPSEKHPEKTAQQKLIYMNNQNKDTKWFCIDVEYIMQRNDSNEEKFGRWDIVAISKNPITKDNKHKVALIELKYEEGAIGGKSGIYKHVDDYINYIKSKNKPYENHLKQEIIDIISNLRELEICQLNIKDKNELANDPEFYFVTLNNKEDRLRKKMRKYLFENEEGCDKRTKTVEKYLKINVKGDNKYNFKPIFLFSDETNENLTINDILDEKQYDGYGIDLRKF